MLAEPLREHRWLERLVGDWTYEGECLMGPDEPAARTRGTESARMIGGLWLLAEGRGAMPDGSPGTMLMTLGYDPRRGRIVGSWVGSMMDMMWLYDGTLDPARDMLTLAAEGPSFGDPDRMARYEDIITLHGPDRRLLQSRVRGEDGAWVTFMTAEYRRAA